MTKSALPTCSSTPELETKAATLEATLKPKTAAETALISAWAVEKVKRAAITIFTRLKGEGGPFSIRKASASDEFYSPDASYENAPSIRRARELHAHFRD